MIGDEMYHEIHYQLAGMATLTFQLDLAGYLSRLEAARDLGPIHDPLPHQQMVYGLDHEIQLARAAMVFANRVHQLAREEGQQR